MSASLPTHVATAMEPIPTPGARPWEVTDMRAVASIDTMLAALKVFTDDEDDVGYVEQFRNFAGRISVSLFVRIDADGEHSLMLDVPADIQIRHRARWMYFLLNDLDLVETRRDMLIQTLLRDGCVSDNRRADPRATTKAMRDFLRAGGRILVTPDGHVTEGGGVPAAMINGTAAEMADWNDAAQAYFEARRRYRSDRQIKRAARMLGVRTEHGWTVLEAPRTARCAA